MPNTLISGPAGAGKTAEARRLLLAATAPLVVADFQSILAALLLLERDGSGRYPERLASQAYALPMAEYVRRAIITGAAEMDLAVVTTNSDGSSQRRAALLSRLGPGAREVVIDPGRDVVRQRLSVEVSGLSAQCSDAIDRWYTRLD